MLSIISEDLSVRISTIEWIDRFSRNSVRSYATRGEPNVTTRTTIMCHSLMELSPSWEAANCSATQEFKAFYGTRWFTAVSTRALHWFLSWAISIQTIPSPSISLSTHLRFDLPSGLFLSGFPTDILYAFLFFPFVLHALPTIMWVRSDNLTHSMALNLCAVIYLC
jgi:hypothetical protein